MANVKNEFGKHFTESAAGTAGILAGGLVVCGIAKGVMLGVEKLRAKKKEKKVEEDSTFEEETISSDSEE